MKLRTLATGLTKHLSSFCSIEIKSKEKQNENNHQSFSNYDTVDN